MATSNIDDKREITGTYYVYPTCHPKHVKLLNEFHVTQTENHWPNDRVHIAYLKKTIIPYIEKVWKQLNLKEDKKTLLIYNLFKGQTTDAVSELLEKKNIVSKKVPVNKVDLFQTLIWNFNKSSKCFLSDKCQTWYANQVAAQLGWESLSADVKLDVRLLVVKQLHGKRVVEFCHHIQLSDGKKIVKNRFQKGHVKEPYDQAIVFRNCAENALLELEIAVLWFSWCMLETGSNLLRQTILPTGVQWWVRSWDSFKETSQSVKTNFDLFFIYKYLCIV